MKMPLEIRKAPAAAGTAWLQQGWAVFKLQPDRWIMQILLIHALTLVGFFHPVLQVIVALINPFLMAGFYQNIVKVQQGGKAELDNLWQPLTQPWFRLMFFRIAVANLICSLPASYLLTEIVAQVEAGAVQLSWVIGFVLAMSLNLMLFAYATAIAYFLKEPSVINILQLSLTACLRNVAPLTVFGFFAVLLYMTAVPTMFISLILVLPWMAISFFMSFIELFGYKADSDQPQESKHAATSYFEV